jgi:Animal haem peroxidase
MSTTEEKEEQSRYSRRSFLKRAGAGAGAVAVSGGVVGAFSRPVQAAPARSTFVSTGSQTFGRLFPNLAPFAKPSPGLQKALLAIGAQGGPLDAKDDLSQGPIALITNPALSANNPDNPTHTAGTTFMGQFIDHDITFDTSSKLGVTTDPFTSPNGRTPVLDLDSVYGDGPVGSPALYDPGDRSKLQIGSGGTFADGSPGFEDLPRINDGTAIVGDPRNDENLIISGLHCAFIKFHNRQVDVARAGGKSYPDDYTQARQLTTWHYHWLVLHEFLPLFVGSDMADDVLSNGRRIYRVVLGQAFMPVEFQGACYRFGHSMVRPSYRANLKGNDDGSPFFGFVFDPGQNNVTPDPSDLRGIGCHAPRRFIGWQTFFDFGDGNVKRNKQIDTHISTPLFTLPLGTIASHDQPTVLPQRNLLRQITWSMPSGQAVAVAMGVRPMIVPELEKYGHSLDRSTPLWYYALKEAQVAASGLHLGPVAGRIVAEVLVGLIQSDPDSYVNASPSWTPTVPVSNSSLGFRMVDFLTYAGVDPASRHAQNAAHA